MTEVTENVSSESENVTYPLNDNLRVALKEYLGEFKYNQVSHLINGLNQSEVPNLVILEISKLLQLDRSVRLMQGLQMNVQQINQQRFINEKPVEVAQYQE